jgi:hypothetical protein
MYGATPSRYSLMLLTKDIQLKIQPSSKPTHFGVECFARSENLYAQLSKVNELFPVYSMFCLRLPSPKRAGRACFVRVES